MDSRRYCYLFGMHYFAFNINWWKEMNWISVEDKSPGDFKGFVVICIEGRVCDMYWDQKGDETCRKSILIKSNISHWIHWNDVPKPSDSQKIYDSEGRIRRICMRKLCHQPVYIREYTKYSKDFPLFCKDCIFSIDNYATIACHKSNMPDSFLEKDKFIIKIGTDFIETGNVRDWFVKLCKG